MRHAGTRSPVGVAGCSRHQPAPPTIAGKIKHLYGRISEAGGVNFWFQGLRNCYLAVAERDLLLPSSVTSWLFNRAPIGGIAAGHPGDWTIEQLREPAERIANRIDFFLSAAANRSQ